MKKRAGTVLEEKTRLTARRLSADWLGLALGAALATAVAHTSLAETRREGAADPVGLWVVVLDGGETCVGATEFVALQPHGAMTAMDNLRVGFGSWTLEEGEMSFAFGPDGVKLDFDTRDWAPEDMSDRVQTFPGKLVAEDRIEIYDGEGAVVAQLLRCTSPSAGE